jgi:DNA-binding MarR family transcriptional regulator
MSVRQPRADYLSGRKYARVRLDVLQDAELSQAERAIYVALASFARSEDGRAWPSLATIAGRAGCSTATAKRALKKLEAAGYLVRRRRRMHGNRRLTTVYYLGDPPSDSGKPARPATPPNVRPFKKPQKVPHTRESDEAVAELAAKFGSRGA